MVTAAVLVLALVRAGLGLGSPSPGCGTELDLAPGLSHRVTVTLADPLQGGHSVCRGVSSDLLLNYIHEAMAGWSISLYSLIRI